MLHLLRKFVGTVGNLGTLAMWGCTNSGGSNPTLIQTITFGSGSGVPAISSTTPGRL